jgi:uncharacterized membrane protein
MNETPVQVIVAAFSNPDEAGKIMAELKEGKRAGLIGIQDAAVVVKDADGKLKVTDARRRSRRVKGFITGGAVGALIGLLAGPVGWAALGGSAVGMLAGRVAGSPLRQLMADLGASLTPNSSAIVAVIEHHWVDQLERELAAEGAKVVHEALKQDIAEQLQAGGNVLYTVGGGSTVAGAARIVDSPTGAQVSGIIATDEGIFIGDAQITDEEPAEEDAGATAATG